MNTRVGRIAAFPTLVFALVACDNVTGTGSAELETLVVAEGIEDPPGDGSIHVAVAVTLEGPDGFPVDVSNGVQETTVDLAGAASETLGTVTVFPGIYPGASARFEAVEATVPAGEGEEESVVVEVDFEGASSLRATLDEQILAGNDDELVLTVDLGAAAWLAEVDASDGQAEPIPAEVFLDTVRIRWEAR